jgi:hypothetical protein
MLLASTAKHLLKELKLHRCREEKGQEDQEQLLERRHCGVVWRTEQVCARDEMKLSTLADRDIQSRRY